MGQCHGDRRCNFSGASMWGVTFNNSSFAWCVFFGYAGEGRSQRPSGFVMQFAGNGLTGFTLCNFVGAECPLGILQNVDFMNCNFAFAKLYIPLLGQTPLCFAAICMVCDNWLARNNPVGSWSDGCLYKYNVSPRKVELPLRHYQNGGLSERGTAVHGLGIKSIRSEY